MPADEPNSDSPIRRKAGFWQTLQAVLWSFFGVRRGKDHDRDMATLNPLYVVLIGILAAALLVIGLIGMVNWVVSS